MTIVAHISATITCNNQAPRILAETTERCLILIRHHDIDDSYVMYLIMLITIALFFNLLNASIGFILQRDSHQHELFPLNYKTPSDSIPDDTLSHKNNTRFVIPNPSLKAPFPNEICKGKLITLPTSFNFKLVTNPTSTLFLPPRQIYVWLPPHYENIQI